MPYIEVADAYINLDHVALIRKEEHSQFGSVLAIHFAGTDIEPVYANLNHFEELRALLDARAVRKAGDAA